MKLRFLIYGLLGWTMEIFWTGLGSLLRGDIRLQGVSYLWMFPIYGLAVFLEPLHDRVRNFQWYWRGGFWVLVIFTVEAFTGSVLRFLTGTVPWDYSASSRYAVAGLIRLDYAPVWFLVGLVFERIHDFLRTGVFIRK